MIERKDVEAVVRLARISVPEQEIAQLVTEMQAIVGYVEQIAELELGDVEPLSHGGAARDVFRPDAVRPCLSVADALRNAPCRSGSYFQVPRVIAEA